ncbi:MAG TPA: hypothetical protein VEJ18_02435 [Planctomycetota bacterium]|nr:hypothetical protein [Planctomycetota bacterium]
MTALGLALALLGATAGESAIEVKVVVKGMSCESNCGSVVTKALQGLSGAADVKLACFDSGVFTLKLDPKQPVKPSAIAKAVGGRFQVVRVEATLTGTVTAGEKDALTLETAGGAKYALVALPKSEPAKADAPKKDEKTCEGAACEEALGKIRAMLKEKKDRVRVTGLIGECCEGELALAATKAEPAEAKKID